MAKEDATHVCKWCERKLRYGNGEYCALNGDFPYHCPCNPDAGSHEAIPLAAPQPVEATCRCVGGKSGYCDFCTHTHQAEACCADLVRPLASVQDGELERTKKALKIAMDFLEINSFKSVIANINRVLNP